MGENILEQAFGELAQHLGSIGLLVVAVALLWQRQSIHEKHTKEHTDALWGEISGLRKRTQRLRNLLARLQG